MTVTGANGCMATDEVRVVSNTLPPTGGAGSDKTITCVSTSALLQSYGGVSYAWSNGSNTSNTYVTPIENTTYTVTITGVNGCTKTDEVNVIINISYPSVELGEDKAIDCNTPNSTITASGGIAYIWSTGENVSRNNS
ncbi:MAG: hypothetical protein IPQ18_14515 [Saprospiraceae bacterium]|nr:hypothetical protein [Saprospiraceae bacterium]